MKTLLFRPFIFLLVAGIFCLPTSAARAQAAPELVAVLMPTKDNAVHGVLTFTEQPENKVKVVAHIEGFEPKSVHGFHIHEFGDLTSTDGMATGGHFNPEKHEHAMPDHPMRHAGDFGNVTANDAGVVDFELVVDNISLTKGQDAILGRGIIVHAKPDDGSQPTGNAGARLAQGVIGVKNNAPAKK